MNQTGFKEPEYKLSPYWGQTLQSGFWGCAPFKGFRGGSFLPLQLLGAPGHNPSVFMWALLHSHRTSFA